MLSVADASRAVLARVPRTEIVELALADAHGAVLAAPLVAARAIPAVDNSAMDGYAARAADLPATLPVAATIAAGALAHELAPLAPGTLARIFTGAPIPPGADTVIIQEDVAVGADARVAVPASPVGANIRRAGDDFAIGDAVLPAGARLRAWDLGACAALGVARVRCHRRPLVAIVATGDELVDVDTEPRPGQLVDSSAHALHALVREAGGEPIYLGIAKDDPEDLAELLAEALAHDVAITTGGVSVGDRDHVRAALLAAGVTPELWKVAMKPGKPFSFGTCARAGRATATPVFGLPGNPVSTVVAFELFVRPALLAMQGARDVARPRVPVRLAARYTKPAGRAHYLRAHVTREGAGLVARVLAKQGSAMLSSLVAANALVEIPADTTETEIADAIVMEMV